jgi:hypothetical protein
LKGGRAFYDELEDLTTIITYKKQASFIPPQENVALVE